MPKFKDPRTLKNLATETLGRNVFTACQKAVSNRGSGRTQEINISGLQEYIYENLPPLLSCEITVHMMSVVRRLLELKRYKSLRDGGNTNKKKELKNIIMACVYPQITVLKIINLPKYAKRILSSNIHAFTELETIIADDLPTDVGETLVIGLKSLKFLVNFRMQCTCTDKIIQALASCCSTTIEFIHVDCSEEVTDESFKNFVKCHKLKSVSICATSVTAEGYEQFLKNIQQQEQCDDKAKGFLQLGIGSSDGWNISTNQLNEIANTCPNLKQLDIGELRGDMEALVSLTTLEVLNISVCDFDNSNLGCFLRLRGSNLISLELICTDSIDLICIMNNCINIKNLYVSGGSITDKILESTEIAEKACQNLEVLVLQCGCSASSIERMLCACVNVAHLSLMPHQDDITDDFILRLLSNNPLKKLTKFTTAGTLLTMKSVNALIEHCALLKELLYLTRSKITGLDIKHLAQRIADNNLDLETYFYL